MATATKRASVGRRKKADDERLLKELVVTMKGSPEWKEWAREFASSKRVPVAILIDHALASYANECGFREPPER